MVTARQNSRIGSMSDLLPNAEPLAEILQGATEPKNDTRAIVAAASAASSVDELDTAISTLIETWRTS